MFEKIWHRLIDIYPETDDRPFPKKPLPFIWECTRGIRIGLFLFYICVAIKNYLLIEIIEQIGRIANILTAKNGSQEKVWSVFVVLVIVYFGKMFFNIFSTKLRKIGVEERLVARLWWRFHHWLLTQSIYFYQHEYSGRLVTKVQQTIESVGSFLLSDFPDYCLGFMIAIISFLSIFLRYSTWLVIPYLLWFLMLLIYYIFVVPVAMKRAEKVAHKKSNIIGRLTDAYSNIYTVKLFSNYKKELGIAKDSIEDFMQSDRKLRRLVLLNQVVVTSINALGIFGMLLLSAYLYFQNKMDIGGMTIVGNLCLSIPYYAMALRIFIRNTYENFGTIRSGIEILSQDILIKDFPDAKPIQVMHGQIEYKDVDFAYKNSPPVLKKFNLKIKAGEKIGIVGSSGAGKTTLVNLLLRFYEVQAGEILIDGQNIQAVTQESLRSQIAMVTQETSLLHRSIKENIMYGTQADDISDVIDAAKKAEAHEFISRLQYEDLKGYDVLVGERGAKLSGGQRQRVSLARVILKNAPILVLDEATSSLDSEAEAVIQEYLDALMQNKTVLVIAHRLSTIVKMDRLIVLEKGVIVESGTHQELLNRENGVYRGLWLRQSAGFLKDFD